MIKVLSTVYVLPVSHLLKGVCLIFIQIRETFSLERLSIECPESKSGSSPRTTNNYKRNMRYERYESYESYERYQLGRAKQFPHEQLSGFT